MEERPRRLSESLLRLAPDRAARRSGAGRDPFRLRRTTGVAERAENHRVDSG